MALSKQIVLITGGNAGIGYSLASLLLADKTKHVIITSRSQEKGKAALKQLQDEKKAGSVEMLGLEITSPDSITKLASEVERSHGRLDALVNNAGQAIAAPGTSLFDHMQQCFAVNVSGPAVMIETFLPLLRKSSQPRIINVGSGAGSMGITLNPKGPGGPLAIPYKASKCAENMMGAVYVAQWRQDGDDKIKLFTYCPGYTVSNLSHLNKAEHGAKPTEEGASPMIAILNGEKDAEHGGYLNSSGGQHPW